MKKILGLDLGTTSVGWALVNEAEDINEQSSIIKLGVRVIPLSTDEKTDFERGKPITINADRTLKRGARRNLQRFKLRRQALIQALVDAKIISHNIFFPEVGKDSTHKTLKHRALAASEQISLENFAKVLLMINKKRGYKSSRKAKNDEEGALIDGMDIAKQLYEESLTPGQYVFRLLQNGQKYIPDFYRSDLQNEFDLIWAHQSIYYPHSLTPDLKAKLVGKTQKAVWTICKEPLNLIGIKQKGKRDEIKKERYMWRAQAVNNKIELEQLAIILQEINGNLNKSSGYLGAISDRSKELFFNKETVGQNLYKQITNNPHQSLKNQVFYRQDYLDEFEKIWEQQAKYYKKLTPKLKESIRDVIIFYQRRLKSQKGLVGRCDFESYEVELIVDGRKQKRRIGPRVVPKSSPLFQIFKIWQNLNHLELINQDNNEVIKFSTLDQEIKDRVFEELNLRGDLSITVIKKMLGLKKPNSWKSNYDKIQGNITNQHLYNIYQHIAEEEGYGFDWSKKTAEQINEELIAVFPSIGINPEILSFDPLISGNNFDKQAHYQIWHLLYSAEDDKKTNEEDRLAYGNNNVALKKKLHLKYGFKLEYGNKLANIALQNDYGNLSAKAIRKILPFLIAGNDYSEACLKAGYNHSGSLTKEELASRSLENKLNLLKKNRLRNPVVEKVLNQMINVVNQIIDVYGKPDEVRVELARELKKSAKEREDTTKAINKAKKNNDEIRKILQTDPDFKIKNPSRNDIIKYKLYDELLINGYKTLYSNRKIAKEQLFSKEIDIEHIIPQALVFDDSFSNKTLSFRDINLDKGNSTAFDFIAKKRNSDLEDYKIRIEKMLEENKISKTKHNKLLMTEADIPTNFIDRDLRNSQFIAKKAVQILNKAIRTVSTTTGKVTSKLREDWDLINVMKELNLPKYKAIEYTQIKERKNGNTVEHIKNWTKRNDHRHHAMDALTVAFTTYNHINYLNFKNAARNEKNKELYAIRNTVTAIYTSKNGSKKRRFIPPMPNFRQEAKEHLAQILISFKTKNKVVTRNKNKTKNSKKPQITSTPRGQLHKETIYGKKKFAFITFTKIDAKLNKSKILTVTKPTYRTALLNRLESFGNDPKKAFSGKNSIRKNPIYLDQGKLIQIPEKVKTLTYQTQFTIRKPISPELKIDKVVDYKIKDLLEARLAAADGDKKKAFGDLKKQPIWLNKEKGIAIKSVTITGVENALPLHDKKDHFGKAILNEQGNTQGVDYISTGNNHHVAIYKDEEGNLHEDVVSFFKAVTRANQNIPIVDKLYNQDLGWQFLFTMKQNEMFLIPPEGFDLKTIDLSHEKNLPFISKHLYRVQKIATKNYTFRHHLETTVDDIKELKGLTWKQFRSTKWLKPIQKIRINHIGNIVQFGEF